MTRRVIVHPRQPSCAQAASTTVGTKASSNLSDTTPLPVDIKCVLLARQRRYAPQMKSTSPHTRPRSGRNDPSGAPAFLWSLVGVMSAIEIVVSLSEIGLFGSSNWRWFTVAIGAFWQPLLSGEVAPMYPGQQFLMFITYAFLHGGIGHLALNCVVLLSLGKLATTRVGAGRTLLVLFLSAVGGSLAFGLISPSNIPMIGASGAAFGLIGLWQAWEYGILKQSGQSLKPVISAIIALVAANFVFFYMMNGGLAWETHLGGWLVGWLSGRSFARI